MRRLLPPVIATLLVVAAGCGPEDEAPTATLPTHTSDVRGTSATAQATARGTSATAQPTARATTETASPQADKRPVQQRGIDERPDRPWWIWQQTDAGSVDGISGPVDVNVTWR